jgi:hypothetical protein
MIMSFIDDLQKSRITVFISYDDHEKRAFNTSADDVTTILIFEIIEFSISIAYESCLFANVEFEFLDLIENNRIVS